MKFNNDIPFQYIYQSSLKEASRKKPIFFIHKYFARRITSNFRMALIDYIFDDDNIIEHFYKSSTDKGKNITVLDPFMGGGTTILESLRFGCNVIGNDLQPLSLFVTKALIEPINENILNKRLKILENSVGNEIKQLYKTQCPFCMDKADIMYSFHIKKSMSGCKNKQHRFFSSYVISLKKDVFTIVCPDCGKLQNTKFSGQGYTCSCGWHISSPKESMIHKGVFSCPDCNEKKSLLEYVNDGCYPFDTDIIAIEYYCPNCGKHDYKSPDKYDVESYKIACDKYYKIKNELPIPQQEIPQGHNTNQIRNHGYNKFKQLFNPRQLLALGMLLKAINNIPEDEEKFWFQLAFSGMLEMNNMFCRYQQNASKISNIFFNHAYVPITMPVENCIWGTKLGTGTYIKTLNKIIKGKHFNKEMYDLSVVKDKDDKFKSVKIYNGDTVSANIVNNICNLDKNNTYLGCSDSRDLSFIPNETVDLILTDPPYGANVMYSELIDFFHSWNYMSSSAEKYGFKTPLSPKIDEIIVNNIYNKDFNFYKNGLTTVFNECYKKLKQEGFLVFSFHDKSIESWLSIFHSIYLSGFDLIKTYPVQSEARTGAHTSGKNSIAIDMMLVCKKLNYDNEKEFVTINELNKAKNVTKKEINEFIEKFSNVKAELTLPDIENMLIPLFIKNCNHLKIFDNSFNLLFIEILNEFIKEISNIYSISIVEKRTGWWSELFLKKWEK